MLSERPQSPQEQRASEEPELGGEGSRIVGQRRAGQRLGVLLLRRLLEGAIEDLHGQAEEPRAVPGEGEQGADGERGCRPAETTAAIRRSQGAPETPEEGLPPTAATGHSRRS